MRIRLIHAIGLIALLALAGCAPLPAGPTVQVGPASYEPFSIFQQDQLICEQDAQARVSSGLANWGQAAAAQTMPGALQQQYDVSYAQCMSAKGNQVAGEPPIDIPPPPPLGSPPPPL